MDNRPDISHAIAAAARTSNNQHQSIDETLVGIVHAARDSVRGFDQVGISVMYKNGNVETRAATGEIVYRLDDIQQSLGEGPCVDTLRGTDVVVAPRLRHDRTWPRYVSAAVEQGLQSQLAIRLYLDDEGTLGGLNLYSTTSDEIHPEGQSLAELFAAHAAIAMGGARERDYLPEALRSHKVIAQAMGILMERYTMNEDRTFAFLVRASTNANVKLRDVAQHLVDERNTDDRVATATIFASTPW
jgi:hypothetical protein